MLHKWGGRGVVDTVKTWIGLLRPRTPQGTFRVPRANQLRGPKPETGIIRSMSLESVLLDDFSGGLNTRDFEPLLRPNETPDCSNVVLRPSGGISTVPGLTAWNDNPVAQVADHLRVWYPIGVGHFLFGSYDGDLYSTADPSVGDTLVINGTAGSIWCLEDMQTSAGAECLWAVNGVDAPRKITSGGAVSNWTAPVATLTDYIIIRVWRNRMVAIKKNSNRVYFSAIGNPESFGANDFIDVKSSDEDQDFITWAEVLGDNLIIFKKRSVWSIYAEPPAPAVRKLGEPGCFARFQSYAIEGKCYFWAPSGLWSTDGDNAPVHETKKIKAGVTFNTDEAEQTSVRVFGSIERRRIYVACKFGSSSSNNILLEGALDMRGGEEGQVPWVKHAYTVASAASLHSPFLPVEGNMLMLADSASNVVSMWENDYGAGDNILSSGWRTAWISPTSSLEKFERWRRLNVVMGGEMSVETFADFDTLNTVASANLVGTVGIIPDSNQSMRPEMRCRRGQISFIGDSEEPFILYNFEIVYRGGKEH